MEFFINETPGSDRSERTEDSKENDMGLLHCDRKRIRHSSASDSSPFKRPLKPPPRRRKSLASSPPSPDSPAAISLAPRFDTFVRIVGANIVHDGAGSPPCCSRKHGRSPPAPPPSPDSDEWRVWTLPQVVGRRCGEEWRSLMAGGSPSAVSQFGRSWDSSPGRSLLGASPVICETKSDLAFLHKASEQDVSVCGQNSGTAVDFPEGPDHPVPVDTPLQRAVSSTVTESSASPGFVLLGKPASNSWSQDPPCHSYQAGVSRQYWERTNESRQHWERTNESRQQWKTTPGSPEHWEHKCGSFVNIDVTTPITGSRGEDQHSNPIFLTGKRALGKRKAEEAFGKSLQAPLSKSLSAKQAFDHRL